MAKKLTPQEIEEEIRRATYEDSLALAAEQHSQTVFSEDRTIEERMRKEEDIHHAAEEVKPKAKPKARKKAKAKPRARPKKAKAHKRARKAARRKTRAKPKKSKRKSKR